MRLIDADNLKYKNLAEVNGKLTYVLTAEEIDNAPTVIWCSETSDGLPLMDLRPRPQGKWIFKDHNYYDDRSRRLWAKFTCSCCNEQRSFYEIPETIGEYDTDNFCPNCGAQMVKGGAE